MKTASRGADKFAVKNLTILHERHVGTAKMKALSREF